MHTYYNGLAVLTGGSLPPLTVDSSLLVSGFNADLLDGYHYTAFSFVGHTHDAGAIISGVLDSGRLAYDSPQARYLPFHDGTAQRWRTITIADIPAISGYMAGLLTQPSAAQARSILEAAKDVHYHSANDITTGIFQMNILGNVLGTPTSSWVLAAGSPPQWKKLGYGDVEGAVGIGLPPTSGRVAMWSGPSTISDAPITAGGGFVGVVAGYGFAVADDALYINGVKLPKPPSTGLLYGLRAGGGGSTSWEVLSSSGSLPAAPQGSDGPYVLVKSGNSYSWELLTGDGVGIN